MNDVELLPECLSTSLHHLNRRSLRGNPSRELKKIITTGVKMQFSGKMGGNHRFCLPLSAVKSRLPVSFMAHPSQNQKQKQREGNGDCRDANESAKDLAAKDKGSVVLAGK